MNSGDTRIQLFGLSGLATATTHPVKRMILIALAPSTHAIQLVEPDPRNGVSLVRHKNVWRPFVGAH